MSYSANESRTLWLGDLDPYMDEKFLTDIFQPTGGLVSVKIMRDKIMQTPMGFGFVEFISHDFANSIITKYNGQVIPGTQKVFRMNWGVVGGGNKGVGIQQTNNIISQGMGGQTQKNQLPHNGDVTIYVGDLDPAVTDVFLFEFYNSRYQSTVSAKVIIDSITKFSKGYGFVKFCNIEEGKKAQQETNGIILKGRHIKTNTAQLKHAQVGIIDQSSYLNQVQQQMGSQQQIQQQYVQPQAPNQMIPQQQLPPIPQAQVQQQLPVPNFLAAVAPTPSTQILTPQTNQIPTPGTQSQQIAQKTTNCYVDEYLENAFEYMIARSTFHNSYLMPY